MENYVVKVIYCIVFMSNGIGTSNNLRNKIKENPQEKLIDSI